MTQAMSLPGCCTENDPPKDLWIVALGNDCRGDDALGPLLIERLQTRFDFPDIDYSWHYLLCIEDALSLPDYAHVLFIDASVTQQTAFKIQPLQASLTTNMGSHALTPAELLQVYFQHVKNNTQTSPEVWLLQVQACQFELGCDLSPTAHHALEEAWEFLSQGLGAYIILLLLYRFWI